MEQCPFCQQTVRDALVVCCRCGATLSLRVIVVSEGSHGPGFALVVERQERAEEQEETQRRG